MSWVAPVIIGLAVVLGIGLLWMMKRSRKLQPAQSERIKMLWGHAQKQPNPTLKIVEADKILDEALKMLGYQGTLGEKMKKAGPRFSDLNGLWRAHKLRNTLVHDLQAKPSDGDISAAMRGFERGLKDLGM